jgi:hypothetical protein
VSQGQNNSASSYPRIGSVFPIGIAGKRTELDRQLSHVASEDRIEKVARVMTWNVRCSSFNITELSLTRLLGGEVEEQTEEFELLWSEYSSNRFGKFDEN